MTKKPYNKNTSDSQGRRGVVLLLTLVMMVALTALVYTVTHRTTAQRYRSQYFIDYAKARYGCESGIKQALAYLPSGAFEPTCVARPNEPDFSDLFYRTDEEIQELIDYYQETISDDEGSLMEESTIDSEALSTLDQTEGFGADDLVGGATLLDQIPGPYGPRWPLVMEPYELDFLHEDVRVTVEIEDENAKYPMTWLIEFEGDEEDETLAGAREISFETFGEWMNLSQAEMGDIQAQMESITEVKPYQTEFEKEKAPQNNARDNNRRTSSRGNKRQNQNTPQAPQVKVDPELRRDRDFANLFNSDLLDLNVLARPTYQSEYRSESALKYMGRWGHLKVNINTAPQHVLEAALVYGGDAVPVAAEIIRQRQEEPFADLADLKERLGQYADHLDMCEPLITTESTHFTIRVTAYCGVAKVSSIAAVTYTGGSSDKSENEAAEAVQNTTKKLKVLAIIAQ